MGEGEATYAEELRAAMTAAGTSRRALSFTLAERKGTKQASEYRALGKYLAGEAIPEPEQAAILAVELDAHRLALVSEPGERRRGRRAALEARVARIEQELGRLGPDLGDLASLPRRVLALERPAQPGRKRGGQR